MGGDAPEREQVESESSGNPGCLRLTLNCSEVSGLNSSGNEKNKLSVGALAIAKQWRFARLQKAAATAVRLEAARVQKLPSEFRRPQGYR